MRTNHDYVTDKISDPQAFASLLDWAEECLTPYLDQFESLAFRGMSGAVIAPAIAARLGKQITMVRKEDGNHSCYPVAGAIACPYVIVDDFIATGATVRTIKERIFSCSSESRCVGILLWRNREFGFLGGDVGDYLARFFDKENSGGENSSDVI